MNKRWMGKEARWGDRVRVDIAVQILANARTSSGGCIKNLSLSGALVKGDIDCGLHAIIQMNIPVPFQPPAGIAAYVSRKTAEGIGVEWCEFAPPVVKDLLRSPSILSPM